MEYTKYFATEEKLIRELLEQLSDAGSEDELAQELEIEDGK